MKLGRKFLSHIRLISIVILSALFFGLLATPARSSLTILQVPQDYPTLQAAIDAAVTGDTVLVSPGTYLENVVISGKTITLASLYHTTNDPQYIDSTIIDGQLLGPVIYVDSNVGPATTVVGLTIRNGLDGVKALAKLNILDNHFTANDDGVDYTSSGGVLRGNIFENGADDGVDFDFATEALIENNIMRNNYEDGIEIRFQDYTGPMLNIIIRNNQIYGNGQNGIQLISYNILTSRAFTIEHNLIRNNGRVGLGMMDNAMSGEDYRAASIPERIHLFNNTFDGNKYALTGGDNVVAINNIFANSTTQGLKNVDGGSVVAHSMFWNNTVHQAGSNLDANTTYYANLLLDANAQLLYGSPAIDAGTAHFDWQGATILDYPPGTYYGTAPDLGAYESNHANQPTPTSTPTITPTPTPIPGEMLAFAPVADASLLSANPATNYGTATTLQIDGSPFENALLKFTVSGLNGRPVQRATLRLYNVNASNKGGDFYATSNTWSENTVNWNNAPAPSGNLLYALGPVTVNAWYEVDLTAYITSDGTYSLLSNSLSSDGADYSSREGANPPQLIIIALGPTATPTAPSGLTSTPTDTPIITPTPTNTNPLTSTFTPAPSASPLPVGNLRFAVIGDYGTGSQNEEDVATLVKSWNPDFIVTVGDNNYPLGGADTIDSHIGKYYHNYIYPYTGTYGAGAAYNRFFPALGNHDWDTPNAQPYRDYFTLPNNERYYGFVQGPTHFFVIDSDPREPDGNTSASLQAVWLQNQLAASTSTWNIVILHHAPYSSGAVHGSNATMQWPYQAWGADVVIAGHDHTYERLLVDGLLYFVNGLGGASLYNFGTPLAESQVRYNGDYGAMLVEANEAQVVFKFISRTSLLIDSFTLIASGSPTAIPSNTPLPTLTSTFTPSPSNTPLPTPSHTALPTVTPLPTNTLTAMPTASNTPLPINTPTAMPTASNTPLPTNTPTAMPTASNTPLPTNTPTPTATRTPTHTATPTPTASNTPLPTNTLTPSATPLQTTLFSDGFESGNFSAWTSVTIGGDGSATVQTITVRTGSFAARLSETANAQSKAYVRESLSTPEKNLTVSGYFMLTQEGASNGNVPIFRLYDSTGKRLLALYRQNLSSNRVYVTDGTTRLLASRTMPLNTWVKFNLHVITAGNGASTIEVYMDDLLAIQTATVNLGTTGIFTIQIGNDTAKQAFTLFVDNIAVWK